MSHRRLVSYDARLEDLPFQIPWALLASDLVSSNVMETLYNAREFMKNREYRTAAVLFTVALGGLSSEAPLVASILCERAECLLRMNYVQQVLRDCEVAKSMIGDVDEYIAFLSLRSLELLGAVQEAFEYAVLCKTLDPKMRRDKDAVGRLRGKVQNLCSQGYHQVYKTIETLTRRGKILFNNNETRKALSFFTEVLYFFPNVLEAHEYRAKCFFILGDLSQACHICDQALSLSQRTSTVAFNTKIEIKIKRGQLGEALELTREWRMIDPENIGLEHMETDIAQRIEGLQSRSRSNIGLEHMEMDIAQRIEGLQSRSRSLQDLSIDHDADDPDKTRQTKRTKKKVKQPPIRASRQSSGAKPKSKKELQWEEWKREKERQQIGQELEEKRREQENRAMKEKPDTQEQHETYQKEAGAVAAEHIPSTVPPSLPFERTKKRKIRRKTKNLRGKREAMDDDSDASSVCSISTCPGDLDFWENTMNQPRMPTFQDSDTDQGAVSDQPKSSSSYQSQSGRIRRRPPGVQGPYRLCRYYKRTRQPCIQGKLCLFAHSEDERKAWEEDRRRGFRNPTAVRKKGCGQATTKNSSEEQKGGIRPRPLDVFGTYRLCPHHLLGGPCPVGSDRCRFAHSETERKAWEKEREKGICKQNAKQEKAKKQKSSESSPLSLKEWRQAFKGQCRAPLRIPNKGGKYKMCPEWTKGTCKLNNTCLFAHGEKELTAWNEHVQRMETEEMKMEMETENKNQNDDSSVGKNEVITLVEDKRPTPTYKVEDFVSSLPGVTVTCQSKDLDVSLQIPLDSEGEKTYNWTVRVCYEPNVTGHLQEVVLFPQYHKCYTLSSVSFQCTMASPHGPQTHVKAPDNEELTDDFHYPMKPHLHALHSSCEVDLVVSFSTLVFGSYAQVLVLDFGKESHLAVKMKIEVGSQEFLEEFSEGKAQLTLDWTLWDDGSREIIKFEPKHPMVFSNEHLIDKYQLPRAEEIVPSPLLDRSQGLSHKNYINVMHQLLYVEEFYIRKQIASFNVHEVNLHAAKIVVKNDEVLCAQEGWLYGSFHVSRPITPDDAQGRLLLRNLFRSLGSVLIAKSGADSVVYEALVVSVEDSRVILRLSHKCCKDLALSNNTSTTVDVQFHINRLPLCEMHDNIARLGPEHFRILFPELSSVGSEQKIYELPWILDSNLNEDQKEIIKKIAAPAIDFPPLVVFGPFGTGKTFALNQAIRRISVNQNNRVLICTHSNSAADIHVELLDTYLKKEKGIVACKPLRIYAPLRKLSAVSDTVKEYCLVTDKGKPTEAFRLPTREDVIRHRVIVSTLGMSRALFDMDLRRGYFSHILIDEAAQALETETLAPLTLAGNNTKVVFTGDHMQMSPDVFSPQAKKWGFQISLQERLFYDYKGRRKEATLDPNLVLLTENYRSNERVLQFPSDMFYGGKLTSVSNQPLHPRLGPLVFYAALGKEEIEKSHASFRNLAEVNEVVKRVKELSDSWPEEWGTKDLEQIAVVSSYRYQVKTIRDGLRKVGLGAVDVETIENVQGKQFRALFVSTVRTFHTCNESRNCEAIGTESPYLYFLSDPKLLNTALTRAQSLIAVVGDPFSLRTVGDCQGLWEEFIKRCSDNGKLFGIEHNELEKGISQRGLNVNAAEFVPTMISQTSQPPATDLSDSLLDLSAQENYPDCQFHKEDSTFPAGTTSYFVQTDAIPDDKKHPVSYELITKSFDAEDSENESASDSNDASDELSEDDDLGDVDDFAEYDNFDETVPPKDMDPIIQALKEKCEEKAVKRKLKDEAKSEENAKRRRELSGEAGQVNHESALDNVQDYNSKPDVNVAGRKIVHEDIKMKTKKGKTQIFLENMKFKYSERTERLLHEPRVQDQECLQAEYLDRLLHNNPERYRECTLRVSYDRSRKSYGEVQDAASEDIFIEGNTRQTFDRDVVVVKLSEKSSNASNEQQSTSERLRGSICGIRHHAINLRERQFVCTVSRDNPRVMYPINKSMTPIANLTDESISGVPIYKRIQSDERAVRVETLPFEEALSGKYLFVVQYLQWKPQFPYPLGIVTKKIRKGKDLSGTFRVLTEEYKLKEEFPQAVTKELERHIRSWSTIPSYEKENRQILLNAFTIDPPGSKALDDALTVEKLQNSLYKVGVHISDVSYFVTKGSMIDVEAQKRATTYFRGHRYGEVLMLPEELSHDICSLLPNQDRLAVSVYLVLDQDGRVQEEEKLDFGRTIVRSQCRLTYAKAQKVILGESVRCNSEDGQMTSKIEENIRTLHFLAQKRRKLRLSDGSYFHFDHADRKEDLEAHELVEEMMILTNIAVARYLVARKTALSPLRIQRPPKTYRMEEWSKSFGSCAKLSLSLRRHLTTTQDVECVEKFLVPMSTWNCICNARRKPDQRELKLLLCNDNIFPQLAVAHSSLNGLQRKAEDVRAADVRKEDRVHWSLNVREYTRFTSPIRRYLDIVVHRLLFETAGQEVPSDEVAEVYRRCSILSENSSKFEKDCGRAQMAENLKIASCELSAVVEMIERDFIQLQLLSDANQYLSPKQRKMKISHLGPIKQPELDESSKCLELTWKLRIYDASTKNMELAKRISSKNQDKHLRQDRDKILALLSVNSKYTRSGYQIPGNLWLDVLDAVKDDNDTRVNKSLNNIDKIITSTKEEKVIDEPFYEGVFHEDYEEDDFDTGDDSASDDNDDDDDHDDEEEEEEEKEKKEEEETKEKKKKDEDDIHFIKTSVMLEVADSVSIQLSANEIGGMMSPQLQCFNLAPDINICLEHRRFSDKCFAIVASKKASQQHYKKIESYVHVWRPVVAMESATVAVRNDDTFILQNLAVKWRADEDGRFVGEFQLDKTFCKTRQIEIFSGDYACVRVSWRRSFLSSLHNSEQFSEKTEFSEKSNETRFADHSCGTSSGSHSEYETASEGEDCKKSGALDRGALKSYWVGHCNVTVADASQMNVNVADTSQMNVTVADTSSSQMNVNVADTSQMKYKLKLFQHSMKVPDTFENGNIWSCTVEIIKQTIPLSRMIKTLGNLPQKATPLTRDICLGRASRLEDLRIGLPNDSLSIADHVRDCNLRTLNDHQVRAVRKSLRGRFTLIQGPPGTGKTITGVHIAYWFAQINNRDVDRNHSLPDTPKEQIPEKAPRQVLYCGPSNKSVDVVAEYLMRIKGIKILRVYGNFIEKEEFPVPNQVKQTRHTAIQPVPDNLKSVALHHVIRDKEKSPYAQKLQEKEELFAKKKKAKKKVDDETVEEYLQLIKEAEQWVIRSVCEGKYHQIILCTCSVAGSKRLKEACNNTIQCIVDECAMCLEPETIVPIHWSCAEQVVLIGDHMQLQPIVTNRVAKSLGLSKSLFERYSSYAFMLEEQYRMHEDICEFPSRHFYDNKLKTAESVKRRENETRVGKEFVEFWPRHTETSYVPLVFCNVVGEEEELVVTAEEGHERSKSNLKEKDKVVEVIKKLLNCGVTQQQIVVLCPYRAQCYIIQEDLTKNEFSEVSVSSIVKSQGSESDFVIISLVRSLPCSQIDHEPNCAWLGEKLGFVTDEHQINVALTRAKRGLCIIGNKNLLEVCEMWSYLIEHYRNKQCLVDGDHWP